MATLVVDTALATCAGELPLRSPQARSASSRGPRPVDKASRRGCQACERLNCGRKMAASAPNAAGVQHVSPGQRPGKLGNRAANALSGHNKVRGQAQDPECAALSGLGILPALEPRAELPGAIRPGLTCLTPTASRNFWLPTNGTRTRAKPSAIAARRQVNPVFGREHLRGTCRHGPQRINTVATIVTIVTVGRACPSRHKPYVSTPHGDAGGGRLYV